MNKPDFFRSCREAGILGALEDAWQEELRRQQESRRAEAEAEAKKAEAEAKKAEAKKAEAEAKKAEAEAKKAEAEAKKAEAEMDVKNTELLMSLNAQLTAATMEPSQKRALQEQQQVLTQLKRPKNEPISGFSSPSFQLSSEDMADCILWETAVKQGNVDVQIVEVGELVRATQPLKVYFRWLLLHLESRENTLDELKAMKQAKHLAQRKHDREVDYHKLILSIYQAAAAGQTGISFEQELQEFKAREDIRCLTGTHGERSEPTEAKSHYVCAAGNEIQHQKQAVHGNREALGKLLKCVMTWCPNSGGARLCSFVSRIECLWLVEFVFGQDGHLTSCRVAPEFPLQGCRIPAHKNHGYL